MGHLLVAKVLAFEVTSGGNLHADVQFGTRKEWFQHMIYLPKILVEDLVMEKKNPNLDNLLRLDV